MWDETEDQNRHEAPDYPDSGMVINESHIEEGVVWGKQPKTTASCTKKADKLFAAPCIGKGSKVCAGSVIYAGCVIGDDVFIADMVRVREGAQIGDHCTIGPRASIEYDAVLGKGVKVQHGALIGEKARVGAHVFIGPGASLVCDKHMHTGGNLVITPPTVQANAKIGANAVIMPGVFIGEGAVVGAGSVVTHNVLRGQTVVGVPARPISDPREGDGPHTKMVGYVLANCVVGTEVEVAKKLMKNFSEITEIDMCFGEYELVARCETERYRDLVDLVSVKIRGSDPNIVATKTLPAKHMIRRKGSEITVRDCE